MESFSFNENPFNWGKRQRVCNKQYAKCNSLFNVIIPISMHTQNPKCQCKAFSFQVTWFSKMKKTKMQSLIIDSNKLFRANKALNDQTKSVCKQPNDKDKGKSSNKSLTKVLKQKQTKWRLQRDHKTLRNSRKSSRNHAGSERKSRHGQTCAWTGANACAKKAPMLCNAGTTKAQLGCNALSEDHRVHWSRDAKFQHKDHNWDSMKGLPRSVLDWIWQ